MYWCSHCLNVAYESQEKLNEHLKLCMNNEAIRAILPEKNKTDKYGKREDILKFKNYGNSFLHPFSVFLDFESTLINKQKENIVLEEENEQNEDEEEIKNVINKHKVNSCGIKYNCIHDKYSKPITIINNEN